MSAPHWQPTPLADVLQKNNKRIPLVPDDDYKQITVRLWGKGLALRGVCKGAEIAASEQIEVKAGQFIISKIDARHGAFGLVPPELDGAVVSGDFPSFDVNAKRMLPRFLLWLSRTEQFVSLCRGSSEGSTNRVRLKEATLLTSKVALPPISEQRRIVERLDAVSTRLKAFAETAEQQEAELAAMLGASFAQMIVEAPRVPMAELAPVIRRPVTVAPDQAYDELGVRSFGKGTFHKPALSGLDIGNKRIFRIEPGDLIFSNVFAWEGAVAIARPEDAGRVGSHRFITCIVDQRRIVAEILWFFFLTKEVLGLIGQASPGGAGRNRTLGLEALGSIRVPVPPLEAQRRFDNLHAKVTALRSHQAAIAADADALLPSVLVEIFG